MATIVEALLVTLGLDTKDFRKGEEEAEKSYGDLVKKATESAKAIVDAAKAKASGEVAAAKTASTSAIGAAKAKAKAELDAAKEAARGTIEAAKGKSLAEIEAAKKAAAQIVAAAKSKGQSEVAAATKTAQEILAAAQSRAAQELSIVQKSAAAKVAEEQKAASAIKSHMVQVTQETNEKVKEQAEKGKEFFKGMAQAAAGFFGLMLAAGAMVEFVKGTLEAEVSAGRLSKTLNMDVEDLEAFQGAVKRVGGTTEGMDSSLKGLNSRLEMIAIHGPRSAMSLKVFAGLGISEVALKGKDATKVMSLLAEKMEHMSGAKAMALGERLGLDEGTVRLLQKGKEGMEALTGAIKKHVASKEQVDQAGKFEDFMKDLKGAMAATGRELMTYLMPALLGMASALAKVAQWIRDNSGMVKAGILGIAAAFLAVNAAAIVTAIQAAITWAAMLGPLDLIPVAIALVVAGLYLLKTHIKEVGHFFNWLALEVVFQLLKAFFTVEHAAAKMWKGIKDSAMAPLNWIWEKLKAIIDIAKQEGNFFKAIFHGDVKGAVGAVKAAVGDVGSVTGLTPAVAGGPAWGSAPAQARPSVSAGMALRPSSVSNSHSTSTVHKETHVSIGTVTTNATDANGLAAELPGAIKSHSSLVDQFDGGF